MSDSEPKGPERVYVELMDGWDKFIGDAWLEKPDLQEAVEYVQADLYTQSQRELENAKAERQVAIQAAENVKRELSAMERHLEEAKQELEQVKHKLHDCQLAACLTTDTVNSLLEQRDRYRDALVNIRTYQSTHQGGFTQLNVVQEIATLALHPKPSVAQASESDEAWLAACEYMAGKAASANERKWMPIETAPKDGTTFLVCNGGWMTVAHWHRTQRCLATNGPTYERYPADEYPTHWQPLPPAPVDTQSKETQVSDKEKP